MKRLIILHLIVPVLYIQAMNVPRKTIVHKKEEASKEFNVASEAEKERRFSSATRHYKKAAELGHAESSYRLGRGYYNAGYKFLKKAAVSSLESSSRANYELAHINFNIARKYLQKAENLNHALARQKLLELQQVSGSCSQEVFNSLYS